MSEANTLRAFHDEHAALVRRVVANRVADPVSVKDICQDTWVAFVKGGGLEHENPVALLVTMAQCRVVDHHRRASAVEDCTDEEILRARQDQLLRDRLTERLGAETATKVDVERALAELPEECRKVLHLLFIDDLPADAAAAVLGRSRATIYNIRRDALRLLQTSKHLMSHRTNATKEVQK